MRAPEKRGPPPPPRRARTCKYTYTYTYTDTHTHTHGSRASRSLRASKATHSAEPDLNNYKLIINLK